LGAAVTEAEWDACTDLLKLLAFLHGRPSDRKARLFAVACCRRVWDMLTDERGRRAVEVSERYADGLASREELEAAVVATDPALHTPMEHEGPRPPWNALYAVHYAAHPQVGVFADGVAQAAARLAWAGTGGDFIVRCAEEQAHQCVILRDIFGSLFRPARVDPAWLAWEGGTAPRLAAAVYEERAFDRLPILADALEDAGCDQADLLGHLRGPGPHVRGCWTVDLILGKG
jgi:hypothetical protein